MKLSLAWSNLVHQRGRTLAAVSGITFAVVLVFMQLGFLGSAEAAATSLFDRLDFDLVVVSSQYVELSRAGRFPRSRLGEIESFDGVESALPLYIGFQMWRNPETRRRRNMMIIGFRPGAPVFQMPDMQAASEVLKERDTVIIDRRSRPEFGPKDIGVQTELGRLRITIVGQFTLGTGFVADGVVLVSEQTYSRILGGIPLQDVNMGLIKLRPGQSSAKIARELQRSLPDDVLIRTRSEIGASDRRHWVENTALGTIFRFGVFIALAVGAVFLYQVMSSDIANHLGEYATLKAIGYDNRYLASQVLKQAYYLTLFAYFPGLAISLGLYELTRYVAGIPIGMSFGRAVLVLLLSLGMCSVSGLFALREVRAADPADLL